MFTFPLTFNQIILKQKPSDINIEAAIDALEKINLTDEERDKMLRRIGDGSIDWNNEDDRNQR